MKVIEKIWSELKIEKEIGRGAYGNVYKCVDTKTNEYSAVKVISVPSAENGLVEYGTDKLSYEETQAYYKEIADDMVKEIEILKSLKGTDNIVEIYDAKIAEKEFGVGWYILIKMELLTEFKAYCAKKDFTEADVLKLGTDLCSALSVCHKAKILHRDIKPENIFVDSEGNFKLGDFGVAKQMEKTQGSMSIKGTFNYMSPEVFGGKRCDNRADLYSLAVVMYKLLNNNRMPFIDKNKDTVRYSERQSAFEKRMRGDNIPPISGISNELNMVILKACAFNPVDRYRSAEEFASQLQHIIDGKKIKKSFKKSVIQKIVAAVAVVSVILGAGVFVWYAAFKLDVDLGPENYEEPEYVSVKKGEISSKSINGIYLYYGEDGIHLVGENNYDKVTDEFPVNAYFDGEKIYYAFAEETNNIYGPKYKNTVYIYDVETGKTSTDDNNRDGTWKINEILYIEGEKIYFLHGVGFYQWLCFHDPVQGMNDFKVTVDDKYFFDGHMIYSDKDKKLVFDDKDINDQIEEYKTKLCKDNTPFYKDGKLYSVEETDVKNILFFMYDLEESKRRTVADFKDLMISVEAKILAFNDKYALVKDNEELSLIIYGDGDNIKATKKSLNKLHLSYYIGESYNAFVDPEISDRIILSVEKKDEVYFYTIKEDGKLAFDCKAKMEMISYDESGSLVYAFNRESREFIKLRDNYGI